MDRLVTALLMTLLLFAPRMATAQALWLCALSEDAVRLVCVAEDDPLQVAETSPRTTAVVNGTTFSLDSRRLYSVDLWSPPTEMEFVEQLARSTICYRSPGCSVIVSGERWAAPSPLALLAGRMASRR